MDKKSRYSLISLIVLFAFMLSVHFLYYPKWAKGKTEATISWDVSGYYMYLPAAFIYKDIKKCGFKDDIIKKYQPSPDFQQAFIHQKSGNYVMKYSLGQALIYSPYFLAGHVWASSSEVYPADGFSFPYQFMISIGSLIIAFIGLLFLRKVLLVYFSDKIVALTLAGIILGSNYLNYSVIDGAMTHNTVFTLYAILIYSSMRFYKMPSFITALVIGICVGLAALTRPTEIIGALIPLLWGVKGLRLVYIKSRLSFFRDNIKYLALAIIVTLMIGSLQLIYWKYVSGEWIVYSYEDQGFSWLRPHLWSGIMSYTSGWLPYSPFMVFSLIGFYFLYHKDRSLFIPTVVFSALFIYISFAWDIWWYGGSLGQRTMVQCYPILAFPIAAFFNSYLKWTKLLKIVIGAVILVFFYVNIWFTHQAHKGELLHVAQMKKAYYWKTLFTYEKNSENLKLLDGVKSIYEGKRKDISTIYSDTSYQSVINKDNQFSAPLKVSLRDIETAEYDWIRVSADLRTEEKEWNFWLMSQFKVDLLNNDSIEEDYMIRVQRIMDGNQSKRLYIDIPYTSKTITDLTINFWNAGSDKTLHISDINVETFLEK